MPDITTPATDTPAPTTSTEATVPPAPEPEAGQPAKRGFFNKAQLADIGLAEDILAAAKDEAHAEALVGQEIDAAFLTAFDGKLQPARDKIAETGQGRPDKKQATLKATGAERALLLALQGIQSAAKQKARVTAIDPDPAKHFSTDGYLIGERLNISHDLLVQNAVALIARAKADALPGHPAARITEIEDLLKTYRNAETDQTKVAEDTGEDRIARDTLVKEINTLRIAIQHAADRIYPYAEEENLPARKTFHLPPDRALNG
jgi:hypothetical protein